MGRLLEVAPGIAVATSRRDTTTSTVIGRPDGLPGPGVLIDPAWDPDELDALADELATRDVEVVAGLATHAHHDHVLWHPGFGAATRYASATTVALARRERRATLAALGPTFPPALAALVGLLDVLSGPLLAAGREFVPIVHDGHIAGHSAFFVTPGDVLVAGDMMSEIELPLPGEGAGAIAAYADGLDRLAPYVARAALVIPGHGSPTTDATARLAADRRYLDDLLAGRQVEDARLDDPAMVAAHALNLELVRS